MRVLFASGYNPFQIGSGPSNGLYHLSQALAAVGCEVHVLTPKISETRSIDNRVNIHYFDSFLQNALFSKSWLSFSPLSVPQINKLVRQYNIDIVNGRSPTTFAYSFMRKSDLPFVVSVHGTSFGEISSYCSALGKHMTLSSIQGAWLTQPTWAYLTNIEYHYADALVAVSNAVADELSDYYRIDKQKITVIPNGVSVQVNKDEPDDNLILSVGRMVWRKGFFYLITAMIEVLKEFPKAKLLLVGQGPYKQKLVEYTKRLNLSDSVLFSNNLPKEDLLKLYSKAQIYIQPSLYEPLGNTILEAMACQKSVIACNVGGIPEIITDQTNGVLVSPYNSSHLAEAINTLLSDASYRKKLGRNAKLSVEQSFSWESVAKKNPKFIRGLYLTAFFLKKLVANKKCVLSCLQKHK